LLISKEMNECLSRIKQLPPELRCKIIKIYLKDVLIGWPTIKDALVMCKKVFDKTNFLDKSSMIQFITYKDYLLINFQRIVRNAEIHFIKEVLKRFFGCEFTKIKYLNGFVSNKKIKSTAFPTKPIHVSYNWFGVGLHASLQYGWSEGKPLKVKNWAEIEWFVRNRMLAKRNMENLNLKHTKIITNDDRLII
jgi:hypothetical protein